MKPRQRVGHRVEFVRQTRRAAVDEVDDQGAARKTGPWLDHLVKSRRAAGRRKMAKRFRLQMQARRRRRIVFVGIGDPRETAVL